MTIGVQPTFRVQIPEAGVHTGSRTKIFIAGQEIPNVEKIEFSTVIGVDEITRSKLTLTIAEAIEVETSDPLP